MALNFDDEYDWGLHIAGPSRTKKYDHGVMDVDPPQPTTSRGHADATIDVIPQAIAEETPFQQLIRHWMNERHAPDILHAQDGLLGRLLDHIKKQTSDVQLLRTDPEVEASEDEHFRIMLVQTEIERVKFVIRSYIRTRLHKIEKYARFICITPEIHERLTQAELDHARRYARLVETHFDKSVLQSLPQEQRSLDDQVPFLPPMISRPDKNRAVFAHAIVACPPVRLPDGATMEMTKDQISLTPYEVVEQLLVRGEVELV